MTEDEKERVRALFVYVIQLIKSEARMSAKVSSELASVLGTVHGLDPTFDDVLENNRAEVDRVSEPLIRANLQNYEDMICRIENGEFL